MCPSCSETLFAAPRPEPTSRRLAPAAAETSTSAAHTASSSKYPPQADLYSAESMIGVIGGEVSYEMPHQDDLRPPIRDENAVSGWLRPSWRKTWSPRRRS